MKYFETYNRLLELMNKGVSYYSVDEVADSLSSDDDCDVERASHILEEHGIVKSCGDCVFAFVGNVELMRNFIVKNNFHKPSEVHKEKPKGITLEDITETKWSLAEKKESDSERISSRFTKRQRSIPLLDDDDDDDDISGISSIDSAMDSIKSRLEALRREREKSKAAIIPDFIRSKSNYNEEDNTFSPLLGVTYPDGTPFVMRFVEMDENHCFTDNGLLKKYLSSITQHLPQSMSEEWVKGQFYIIDDNSSLVCKDGIIYNIIDGFSDDEDLNSEIFYLVRMFEDYLTKMNKSNQEIKPSESEELFIKRQCEYLTMKNAYVDLFEETVDMEECVWNLLKEIADTSENINRSHALSYAEQFIARAKENDGMNLAVFERLLETINSLTDIEFQILKRMND